jgi:hypothetical protein
VLVGTCVANLLALLDPKSGVGEQVDLEVEALYTGLASRLSEERTGLRGGEQPADSCEQRQ